MSEVRRRLEELAGAANESELRWMLGEWITDLSHEPSATDDLRASAEWLVQIGYPYDFNFTPRAPEALWQAVIDVVHEDADGSMHGNELAREQVADWLTDP